MSLKAFHLVFVTALTALTFGCCVWKFYDYFGEFGTPRDLVLGGAALLACVGVLVYGRLFLKKLKKISYL